MKSPDVLDRVRGLRPEDDELATKIPTPTFAYGLLEQILITEPEPRRRPRTLKVAVISSACFAGVAGLAFSVFPGEATATVRVSRAAQDSAKLLTGRATMTVTSTLDGVRNDGSVDLAWDADEESCLFKYPASSGTFETRVVDRKVLQRIAIGGWKDVGGGSSQLPKSGGLEGVVGAFAGLSKGLAFEEVGKEGRFRQYRATGDLSSLDSSDGGFVFGTDGALGAETTSLDVWVDGEGLLAKVRTTFSGNSDGHVIEAVAVTEFRDIGLPVEIDNPLTDE